MADLRHVERAAPLHPQARLLLPVLEGGHRRFEIARISQTVGAYGTAIRQGELGAIVLAHVSTGWTVDQLDLELDAARYDADLAGLDGDPAELREEAQRTLLRHDEELAVSVVEVVVFHGLRDEVDVRRH